MFYIPVLAVQKKTLKTTYVMSR